MDMSEGSWNAAIAGHFGVPVIMMSGDDAAIREVRSLVGPIEAAEVKKSLGFHSANTITPEASVSLIGDRVRSALRRVRDFTPYRITQPVTLDVTFKHYRVAEVLAYLRGVERISSHSIRYVGNTMPEIADFMLVVTNYSLGLEP
ncbi:MAG: M55 family metallopeptidase, partial [Bacteroidota bacterium]